MALSAGTRLGPYAIVAPLGAGGMGEVYRARDTKLDRDVAIKILPELLAADPDRIARFEREAKTLASLNHPHIAAIYGFEEATGIRALVMELVDGPTLADRITQGPIPIADALPMATQVADALEAAHEQGIIHRDLKPANIKVREDGTVKVLDFGLAKLAAPDASGSGATAGVSPSPTITSPAMLTGVGMILGTAAYMSPEQAKGRAADKRSDIWAFGVVLYEMLTGEQLFRGDTITDVLAAVVRSEPDLSRVPLRTRRLIRSCLEKDPRRRLQAISDAWLLLDDTAPGPQSAHWSRPVAWLPGAALALIAAAGLWTLWRQPVVDERALQFYVNPPPGAIFQTGLGGGSSVSPDGRAIAFVATSEGSKLWIRRLDSLTARELPGTIGAAVPFWAPDSRSVGFFAEGMLKKIAVSGGPPVVITAAPESRGGTWGRGGTIVFSLSNGVLQQVAASGGTPAPLTTLDAANGESSHRWPQFLPDGRHFLYFIRSSKTNRTGIYLGSLDRPHEKMFVVESLVAGGYSPPHGNVQGSLLWVGEKALLAQPFDPDRGQLSGERVSIPGAEGIGTVAASNRAMFSASIEGTLVFSGAGDRSQLAWFSRDGKVLSTVSKADQYAAVRISPDGNLAAVSLIDSSGKRDIWGMELARGLPNRLTNDGNAFVPVWSPDGHRIAYHDALQSRLFTIGADGDDPQKIMESKDLVYINDWSPDGRFLMYTQASPTTLRDLWLVPTTGERKPVPVLVTPFSESHGQFSPDGKWIAYTSTESGQEEIYVRSVPAKGSTRVSTNGGSFSRWRKDGKELFYRSPDGRLMAVSVANVADRLEFGTPVPLLPIVEPFGTYAYPYDIAPDGQKVLALTSIGSEHEVALLTVIINWDAGLRK